MAYVDGVNYLVSLIFPTSLLDRRSEDLGEETTTDMPSTIVNIKSGVNTKKYCGYSCSKSYHYHVISIMPMDLRSSGFVQVDEWESFCDQVNKRLEPLNKLQRIFQFCSAIVLIGFAAFMAIVTVRIASSIWNDLHSFADDGGIGDSTIKNIALYLLIPLTLTVARIGLSCYISIESQKVYKGINDICVDASTRNRNVSYHFRNIIGQYVLNELCDITDITHDFNIYIEVFFSSNEMSVVEEPTALPVAVLMTPEARLQELEDITLGICTRVSSNEMSVVEEPTALPVAVLMTPEARLQELEDITLVICTRV